MDGKDKTIICSHCKCSGHDVNSCFTLIGYPEWWDDRPDTDEKNESRDRRLQSSLQHGKDKTNICSNCKRSGHDANSYFTLIGYLEWWGDRPRTDGKNEDRGVMRVNASQAIPGSSTIGNTSDGNDMESLGLSPDQLQVLMKLLKDQNNHPTENMTEIPCITTLKVDKGVSLDLWHRRLGHLSMQATKIVSGVDLKEGTKIFRK